MPETIFFRHRGVVVAAAVRPWDFLLAAVSADTAQLAWLTHLAAQNLAHIYLMIVVRVKAFVVPATFLASATWRLPGSTWPSPPLRLLCRRKILLGAGSSRPL